MIVPYTFKNKKTGEEIVKEMELSETTKFLKDNPHLEYVVPRLNYSFRGLGGEFKDKGGFTDVLEKIHRTTPGSRLNETSTWLRKRTIV